jgi:hypothetical protein
MNTLHIGLVLAYPTDLATDDMDGAHAEIERLAVVEKLAVEFPGATVKLQTPEVAGPSDASSTPFAHQPGTTS